MTTDEPDFAALRKAVVAGIDPNTDPPIIPTLVVEYRDRVDVSVLDPAPNYADARDVAIAWMTDALSSCSDVRGHCIAFAMSPDRIELRFSGGGISSTLFGIIDRESASITWDDPHDDE